VVFSLAGENNLNSAFSFFWGGGGCAMFQIWAIFF
jgi:hypothetical protein